MLIEGRCHCGNIAFSLRWEPDPDGIPARACDCTFCTRHGNVWTSHPEGRLQVRMAAPEAVSRYAFGTQSADFHVCMRCGVVPLVTSTIGGHVYAVVNVNTFDNVDPALLRPVPASFGEEAVEVRLERRRQRWIRHVAFA